jgi:hypothetical protein
MADSTAEKARKARKRAYNEDFEPGGSSWKTNQLVTDLTRDKPKGADKVLDWVAGGRYPNSEELRAASIMQQRRKIDTAKTAARATAIEKRTAAAKKAKTLTTGVSGGAAPKKKAPKK